MPKPRRPRKSPKSPIAPRKQPAQARSAQLVADLLAAAIRVLERDGPRRFTTIRVAEAAGVSVGSLYQYFPNKQAILYRLQVDEWRATGAMLEAILGDDARAPDVRLRAALRAFFRSECDEAPLRHALDVALPAYVDEPDVHGDKHEGSDTVARFIAAAAPRATPSQRRFAGELLFATMSSLGEHVSERGLSRAEVDRWADAAAEMLNAYLSQLHA